LKVSIEILLIPIAIAVVGEITGKKKAAQSTGDSYRLITRFKDADLLHEALRRLGCHSVVTDHNVTSMMDEKQLVFELCNEGHFEAVFYGDVDREEAEIFLSGLHDEYGLQVQQQVYQKLLTRAKERGYTIEAEQVLEDSSIVLTIMV
jgi:hypothetical protein